MKNLIGKKVRGFKFDGREMCQYIDKMDAHIGEVGIVKEYSGDAIKSYRVEFKDDFWWYPAELIEQHLVYLTESTDTHTDAIKEAIIKAYFNGTNLPQINETIKQAYSAIEAGVNAQLVEIKEERGKL